MTHTILCIAPGVAGIVFASSSGMSLCEDEKRVGIISLALAVLCIGTLVAAAWQ